MTDHVTPDQRLAFGEPLVCYPAPDWRMELLTALCAILALAWFVTMAKGWVEADLAADAYADAQYWKGRAEEAAHKPGIFIEPGTVDGYRCSAPQGVRREWVSAVAKDCERLAGLMHTARAAP